MMPLLDGIRHWYTKQKLRQATVAAVLAGVGGMSGFWVVPAALDELTASVRAWLSAQLAEIRTPYGVDTCGIMLKLVHDDGRCRRRLWRSQIPSFARQAPQAAYDALEQQLRSLPLADYPTATHLEVQLVSIGDIVAYHDQGR
jgi:hypothetical protein